MKRYFTQTGSNPEISACIHISGPQTEEHVPPEVIPILNKPGIKSVAIIYDHGLGERIGIYQKYPDT